MIYARGSQYAPLIIRSFDERGVPPALGLYVAMVESEYRDCPESPIGAIGMFGFIPATARAYGIDPRDGCDIEKMAPAAAEYMSDRIAEFGADSSSMTLVLLSYNTSPDSVRRDLREVRRKFRSTDRSFWTLLAHQDDFDVFRDYNVNYVTSFFAAAIIGENPRAFGLHTPPLTTLG